MVSCVDKIRPIPSAAHPTLSIADGLYVLDLGEEFRFAPASLQDLADHLDAVAATEDGCALVTVASGKFWASGLDLDWLGGHPDDVTDCLAALHELYARMLELPVVKVAAIQGHAFAAGAMFALVHDYRVMRADRGYYCLPEVDMGIRFTPALALLLRSRIPQPACHEAMVLGRRFGGEEAERAGIVDKAVGADEVAALARETAVRLGGKPRHTIAEIRRALYGEVIARLRDTNANRVEWTDFALASSTNAAPSKSS